MRSDAIRRPHVARPRRDTIAVTIPRNAIWIGAAAIALLALLAFAVGIWIGRGTAEQPAPVSARVLPVEEPPIFAEDPIEDPAGEVASPESSQSPESPESPAPAAVKLDLRERMPRGKHGLQVGAFANREEARAFLAEHAAELAGMPMFVLPAKASSRGVWVRVRVGSFDDKESAEKARLALPPDLAKGSMVVKYP
jgi:cell division septation protein DedD